MWVAKVRFDGSTSLFGKNAKKYSVSLSGYPVSYYKFRDHIRVCFAGCLYGGERNKKAMEKALRKSSRIFNLEITNDFILGEIRESLEFDAVYEYKLIHVDPIVVTEDGIEYWTLGSWNKDNLLNFLNLVERKCDIELLGIFQRNIDNFSILSIQPSLTDKQKLAMDLAIKHGYYEYPRKCSVEILARISKISFSTFHAHLRKAEQKLLPSLFRRTK